MSQYFLTREGLSGAADVRGYAGSQVPRGAAGEPAGLPTRDPDSTTLVVVR